MKEKVTVRKEDRKSYRRNNRWFKFFSVMLWMLNFIKSNIATLICDWNMLVPFIEKLKEKRNTYAICAALDTVEGREEMAKAMLEPFKGDNRGKKWLYCNLSKEEQKGILLNNCGSVSKSV